MKITSKSNSALIEPGIHVATVNKIYTDTASSGAEQLAVEFDANGKKITRWYNLTGFQISKEEPTRKDASGRTVPNYLEKNGKRIEDPAKTESCVSILEQLAFDCGVPLGKSIDSSKLEGEEVGIKVVSEDTGFGERLSVKFTMKAEKAKATADVDEYL